MAEVKIEPATKAKKTTTAAKSAEAAKPAAKKTSTTKSAAKPTVAPKPAAAKKPAAKRTIAKAVGDVKKVTPEQRYLMICEAAYYKAERRGFAPENEVEDWLEAEAEINRLLGL